MNSLFRPILRPSALRAPAFRSYTSLAARSQTLEHAATNVKEELGNSASDLAKAIAGANVTQDSITNKGVQSFFGITSTIAKEVPEPMMVLGLLGANCHSRGVSSIDPGVALTVFDQALTFQVTYGAVMLSFLGALHWGMEISGYGGHKGYARLALGSAPMLVAWSTLSMDPMVALITQWSGYTALWYADSKATQAGWTPKWYSQYRFYLSILVGTCVIGTLAGTSYFGPVAGHGLLTSDLKYLREERKKYMPEKHGIIPGPIEATPAGPEAEKYTRIHRKDVESEK
ncbi:hypothetical protein BDQ17DRAFT_1386679 [Cyathus striatus]|nr:hypothetical protein BDQ17DRAFT_1386679 [Cyathus striatus]